MVRTILGLVVGLVLAFVGVLFLAWVLWRLWTRPSAEQEAAPIEIEVQPSEPVVGARAADIELETEAPDDLKRIEGIGPKLSSVLQEAGISTFAQLAATSPDRLEQILEAADPRLLRLADPSSWPEQAALAAAGEWEALEALQGELKGGRRV